MPKVSPVLAVEAECTFISRPVLPIALPLVTSAPEPALPAASILRAIFSLLVIIAWVVALASYTLNCWKRSRPVQYIAGGRCGRRLAFWAACAGVGQARQVTRTGAASRLFGPLPTRHL